MKTKISRFIAYIIAVCSILYARQVFSQFPVLNLPPGSNLAGVFPNSSGVYLQGNYISGTKIIMTPPFHTSAADYPGSAFHAFIDKSGEQITPGGLFDYVYDRFGNRYKLSDIAINKATMMGPNNHAKSQLLCANSGYFNLYFEQNWENNTIYESDRRAVLCQLFTDISSFINSPLNGSTTHVNIWIRNIQDLAVGGAALGAATAFYSVPNGAPNFSGIADNEIWKTINSGVDSYQAITPLYNPYFTGSFFHGQMGFNFPTNNIWHISTSANTDPTLYDLYSVALHELTHALGFASLINSLGISKFGAAANYYSRYDRFLFDPTYTPPQSLITNSGTCQLYDYHFNSSLPTSSLTTVNCTSQIRYNSGTVDQAVFTVQPFDDASSLSHFEDQCHSPNQYSDDSYYVMSNAQWPGAAFMKRYLKDEERSVLCDIGYSVNIDYISPFDQATHNYTGASICPGIPVVGIDDGINSGTYVYSGLAGSSIELNGLVNGILTNDHNAYAFECLERIIGSGNLSSNSYSSGDPWVSITYTPTSPGIHLLRYIPVSATGDRGNITYVYVYCIDPNCTPSSCNIVNNGGFENSTGWGDYGADPLTISCWLPYMDTPDLYSSFSTDQTCTIPSNFCSPSANTWSTELGYNIINNYMICLTAEQDAAVEAIEGILNSSIQPSTDYILSFWARIENYIASNSPTHLIFAGSPGLLSPLPWGWHNQTPAGLTVFKDVIIQPTNPNQWTHFSLPFNIGNNPDLNYLCIINAIYNNSPMYSSGIRIQVLIDDVSILPRDEVATFLIPPNPICVNQTIPDLNAYCQPSIPGGTFSGPGVSCNSLGVCSFNAALAGVGSHPLFYTYLLSPGCPHVESFTLNVVNSSLSISTTVNSTACFGSCNGSANINIISGASPFTYAWNDNSNQNTNPAINLCAGTYTVSVTDQNNCMATNAVLVNFINIPEVLSNTTIDEECDGTADGSIDLTVSGGTAPYSYNWASTINPNYGTTQDLTNLIPDTYSVTVTDVNGCSATDNIVINIAIPARWPYHPDDGFGLESGTSVAVDEFNFVYATGTFTDHITFDSYQLDAHEFSHYNDVASYIVKLDECGEVKWAKMLYTDLNAIKINKIVVVDAFSFIITGSYWNTADFGNGFSLTSNSNEEWFLAKYTCNSGLPTNNYECQWVVNTGGRDLALDVNNNIYVVGDGITAKYDINGNLLWQNIDPTTTGNAITYCTDCLPGNKILTTGQKNGLVFFNTQDEATGLINPLLSNVFANFPGAGNGIVSHFDNPYNYAYIAGYTANALIKQILLLKIDVSSPLFPVNQYTTGGSSIGIQGDAATDIDINQYNKLFITGHFNSPSITFLGSAPTLINTGLANNNNFVVKYDAHNFSSIWAISSIPTNVDESSMAIVLNNNNDFGYITGGFTGSAQFGIAAALNAISGEDAFIARLQDFSTYGEFRKLAKSSADTVSTKNISVYPNPANDALFIDLNFEEKSFVKLSLFDIFGKQIENPVTGYMKEDRIKMDISRFAAGMYNLKIETNNVTYNYKIIKE